MRDKRSTAYHEAGHAVAKVHFGLKIKKATIVEGEGYLGCVDGRRATNRSIEYDDSGRVQLRAERDIIVSLAGVAAQREFMPQSVRRHQWRSDFEHAMDLLWRIASKKELPTYFKLLDIRSREFVKRRLIRAQIEGVAKELLIRKTMTGEQVKAVILDANQRDFDERVRERRKRERHRRN